MAENGPSRREFDQMGRRLDYMDEHGSRRVGVLESKVDRQKSDIDEISLKLARNTQALWGIAIVLLVGTVGIIATLLTSAPR